MKPHLVSVCIPTLNGSKFLQEALDSIELQTYELIELVVSDDGSSDGTWEILEAYKEQARFPVYLYKHQPSGIGANWNNCIKHAKGKYIKFLFQDDVLESDCMARMVQVAESNTKIGLVYSKRSIIAEDPAEYEDWLNKCQQLHDKWHKIEVVEGSISGKEYLSDLNLMNDPSNKIGEPTCTLIRRDCFEKVGYFNNELKQILDFEMWYRIMVHYDIGFVNKELCSFRLHSNQETQKNAGKKINDYAYLNDFYYHELFPYLHWKNKWVLLKKHHPFFIFLYKVRDKLKLMYKNARA